MISHRNNQKQRYTFHRAYSGISGHVTAVRTGYAKLQYYNGALVNGRLNWATRQTEWAETSGTAVMRDLIGGWQGNHP
jgi:hypothetical protein